MKKKFNWGWFWIFTVTILAVLSLMYTNWLTGKLALEEEKTAAIWADATRRIIAEQQAPDGNLSFLLEVIRSNTTIPIILTDSLDVILASANIDYSEENKEEQLGREFQKMKEHIDPIIVALPNGQHQLIYYSNSLVLNNLIFFPISQLLIVGLLVALAFYNFQASRKREQDNLWVGMSKETAHQLGTPISSLMAWIELLKEQEVEEALVEEFEKDIIRLERIADRFSKIGSKPELSDQDFEYSVSTAINYLKKRVPNKININIVKNEKEAYRVPHNALLLSWVIENICKNAVDSIDGDGVITVKLQQNESDITLDVTDTGKGIAKLNFRKVFESGFTSKSRGWGLGLSLAKRIVEEYHHGRIFVKQSELGKGTTFRLVLKKEQA